jgi:hypothetical protein
VPLSVWRARNNPVAGTAYYAGQHITSLYRCPPIHIALGRAASSNDADYRGGCTNQGVTQTVYHACPAAQGLPPQDVKPIYKQEVAEIYYERYWLAAKGELLRRKLDFATFDTAVDMGPKPGDQDSAGSHRLRGRWEGR